MVAECYYDMKTSTRAPTDHAYRIQFKMPQSTNPRSPLPSGPAPQNRINQSLDPRFYNADSPHVPFRSLDQRKNVIRPKKNAISGTFAAVMCMYPGTSLYLGTRSLSILPF